MVRYLDQRSGNSADERERARQASVLVRAGGHVGAFLGLHGVLPSTRTWRAGRPDGGLDKLLEQLRLWHGGLRVEPGHFTGWSLGARFYPVLYLLTRMGEAGLGHRLPLKASLLGKMNRLEVHHIFPKAQLYKRHYRRPEVNALANFCFLTKDTNLVISDRLPEVYFPQVEAAHPGALASQWIPTRPGAVEDRELPRLPRSAQVAAGGGAQPSHGRPAAWRPAMAGSGPARSPSAVPVAGGITSEDEEEQLEALNDWMEAQGLPAGADGVRLSPTADTGEQMAVFDLAWPNGIQEELSHPVPCC
jgi:hypothetical protein